ncbi:hypothetical protein EV359DRAFT_86309, partial [Lentinula novae-zelandiae]
MSGATSSASPASTTSSTASPASSTSSGSCGGLASPPPPLPPRRPLPPPPLPPPPLPPLDRAVDSRGGVHHFYPSGSCGGLTRWSPPLLPLWIVRWTHEVESTASTPLDHLVDSRGRVHHFYHLVRLYRLWIVRWSPPLLPPCLPLDRSVDSRGEVHHLHYLSSASPASILCGGLTSSLVTNQISLSLSKFWIEIRHYDAQDNEQLPRSQVTKATRRNGTKKSVVMLSPKRRQHAPDPNEPLSPAYRSSTQDPSPPVASGVRRHVSLTYGAQGAGVNRPKVNSLNRAGTLQTAYPNRSTSTSTHGHNGAPTASSPSLSSSSSPSPVQDI